MRPSNELAHRRWLGQNHARIDLRRVGFGPGDERLIDEQLQFASNFFARHLMRDRCCIAIARR